MPLLYQPGDRVIVRSDLRNNERYHMDGDPHIWMYTNEEMRRLAGEVVTIKGRHNCNEDIYSVEGSPWGWTDEMFVGYADEEEILPVPDNDYYSFDWN